VLEDPVDPGSEVRSGLTRRELLAGFAGGGLLVVVSQVVPGGGGFLPRLAGAVQATAGSFTASFDFPSGVATVTGQSNLGGGVLVTVVVDALLNGAPCLRGVMPPPGSSR